MSITNSLGERWDSGIDKPALVARERIAGLDVNGLRRFAINLFLGCGVPKRRIARAFRCSEVTVRRDKRVDRNPARTRSEERRDRE